MARRSPDGAACAVGAMIARDARQRLNQPSSSCSRRRSAPSRAAAEGRADLQDRRRAGTELASSSRQRRQPPAEDRPDPPRSTSSTSRAAKPTCSPPPCSRRRRSESQVERRSTPRRRRNAGRSSPPSRDAPTVAIVPAAARGASATARDRLRYGGFPRPAAHRMLTVQWQRLGPDSGPASPRRVREAGVGGEFERVAGNLAQRVRRLAAPASTSSRRTPSASPSGSATSSTSTRVRRCTCSSCAPVARAPHLRAVARRCTRNRRRPPRVAAAMKCYRRSTEPRSSG